MDARLFMLLAVTLALVAGAEPEGLPPLTVNDFRLRQVDEATGELRYELAGEEAVTRQGMLYLRQVRMVINRPHDDRLHVFSPACQFDRAKQIGRSDERIHVRGRNMTIDGTGFRIDMVDRHITVLDKVRVRIYQADRKMLGNLGENR